MKVFIETKEESLMPAYKHDGDAGMDLRAAEDIIIKPGETKVVKTGIKIAMPKGLMADVRPRSGLSLNTPLRVANAPGTVDSGYRDEVGVIISNISERFSLCDLSREFISNENTYTIEEKGNKPGIYHIKKGDRIAQMVFLSYETPCLELISNINEIQGDRGGGFGHSGVK